MEGDSGVPFGHVMLKMAMRYPGADVDRQLAYAFIVLSAEMKGHKSKRRRGNLDERKLEREGTLVVHEN